MKVLIIDNYDSFVYNLVQYLGELGAEPIVYDKDALTNRLLGDEMMAERVVAGFLSDISPQIEEVRNLVEAGEVEQAERKSHRIKGVAGNVGGLALRIVAEQMEHACKDGSVALIEELLPRLEQEFAVLRQAMEKSSR